MARNRVQSHETAARLVEGVMTSADAALTDEELRALEQVADHLRTRGPYETKTVRIHLPARGQYCVLMVTRFDGRDHLLSEFGWGREYYHYSLVSTHTSSQGASTGDAYGFIEEHDWLADTPADWFVKALEAEALDWAAVEDGMKLSRDDVASLTGRDGEPEVRHGDD